MGTEKEVFLYEGIPHPVMCEKIRYYQDKYFTSRLMEKAKIEPLSI
jgi:type IV secretion system protein VirD4